MSEKAKVQVPDRKAEKHDNIYAALSAFQGELKPMTKSGHVEFEKKTGGTVKFDYTPFGEIMTAIYPLLAKHGLSVRHEVTKDGVEAILTHETYSYVPPLLKVTRNPDGTETSETVQAGHVEGEIRSGVIKMSYGADMKETGGAITYLRRYTLTMVCGISSEDDKDAELLEQSAKNAVQTVYDRFLAGIKKAQTPEEVTKQMTVLQKDVKTLESGKAPALGLSKEQYEELLEAGQNRVEEIKREKAGE